jgi:hypothetical protein
MTAAIQTGGRAHPHVSVARETWFFTVNCQSCGELLNASAVVCQSAAEVVSVARKQEGDATVPLLFSGAIDVARENFSGRREIDRGNHASPGLSLPQRLFSNRLRPPRADSEEIVGFGPTHLRSVARQTGTPSRRRLTRIDPWRARGRVGQRGHEAPQDAVLRPVPAKDLFE